MKVACELYDLIGEDYRSEREFEVDIINLPENVGRIKRLEFELDDVPRYGAHWFQIDECDGIEDHYSAFNRVVGLRFKTVVRLERADTEIDQIEVHLA